MAAIVLRIVICLIVITVFILHKALGTFGKNSLLDIKLQVISFFIPYTFLVLVTTSLIFSAAEFYRNMGKLLGDPEDLLRERLVSENLIVIKKIRWYCTSRARYYITQISTLVLVAALTVVILIKKPSQVRRDDSPIFTPTEKVIIWAAVFVINIICLAVVFGSILILVMLNKLRKTEIICSSGECDQTIREINDDQY